MRLTRMGDKKSPCFKSWFISCTLVPLPEAILFFLEEFIIAGSVKNSRNGRCFNAYRKGAGSRFRRAGKGNAEEDAWKHLYPGGLPRPVREYEEEVLATFTATCPIILSTVRRISHTSTDFLIFSSSCINALLAMMPGMGSKVKAEDVDEKKIERTKAIIQSMTKKERVEPAYKI